MLTAAAGAPKDSVSDVPGCPVSPGQVPGSPLGQLSGCPAAALLGAHPNGGVPTQHSPSAASFGSHRWGGSRLQGLKQDPSQLCPTALPPRGALWGPSSSPVSPFPAAPPHTRWVHCSHHFTARHIPFGEVRGGRRWRSVCDGAFAAAAPYFSPDCSAMGFPTSHSPS